MVLKFNNEHFRLPSSKSEFCEYIRFSSFDVYNKEFEPIGNLMLIKETVKRHDGCSDVPMREETLGP